MHKVWNLRAEHLKVIQAFHTVYIGSVVENLNKIIMLQSTTRSCTKLEHPIYRTIAMHTVWKAWITFKMLQPRISTFFYIKVLLFCILAKVSINSKTKQKCPSFFFRRIISFFGIIFVPFMCTKFEIWGAEHFERYSSYSYCMHSSVHGVFRPSSRGP